MGEEETWEPFAGLQKGEILNRESVEWLAWVTTVKVRRPRYKDHFHPGKSSTNHRWGWRWPGAPGLSLCFSARWFGLGRVLRSRTRPRVQIPFSPPLTLNKFCSFSMSQFSHL